MRLRSIRVERFRSLRDQTLQVDDLTALVGANGVGKSSFLRALEYFYAPAPRIDREDFYAADVTNPITLTAAFSDFSDDEASVLADYVASGQLSVARLFGEPSPRSRAPYFGFVLRHPPFQPIRSGLEIKDHGKTARAAYDALRAQPAYATLPAWTLIKDVVPALEAWEKGHPNACTRERDSGAVVGFGDQFPCNLQRYSRLLYIPAVRDAAVDGDEGRDSVLSALMDLVVRRSLSSDPRLARLAARTQRLYERALSPSKLPALKSLAATLSSTLQTLVSDSSIELKWLPLPRIEMQLPAVDVTLIEDGYGTAVGRTGHGLQRAFIITILQHLASAQSTILDNSAANAKEKQQGPDLILAIEEPELYQHPNRQRHFAKTLARLASGKLKGLAGHTQVLYATHSPLFVGLDRIANLRLLRRLSVEDKGPKVTRVVAVDLDSIAERLWTADGGEGPKFTATSLLPRLQTIMTPAMSEGFFAKVVLLVEGEDDRAALLGVADHMAFDLEAAGIAIIPAGGKTSLDRPYTIFDSLGIPCYPIWDGDRGSQEAKPTDNHRLQRLLGLDVVDWPATTVDSKYACFATNLDDTIRQEIGNELFEELLKDCQNSFGIAKAKHARKNPAVLARILAKAHETGAGCPSLRGILGAARGLAS